MRICKECKIEKPLSCYTSYKNYPTKFRLICKECENKKAREKGQKLKEEFQNLIKDEDEILREFNNLKSADQILKLLEDGYDVTWSKERENLIIFSKDNHIIHAKNASKKLFDIIFARYSIRFKKNNANKVTK